MSEFEQPELPLTPALIVNPEASVEANADAVRESMPPAAPRLLPHFGHVVLFLLLIAAAVLVTSLAMSPFLMAGGGAREKLEALKDKPIFEILIQIGIYLVAIVLAWPVFSILWRRPFLQGVYWNAASLRRTWWRLMLTGGALAILVAVVSNYLPMPKDLPIDQFFKTPMTLWVVAVFGTTLGPFMEELVFRGFLLPALANAWEWFAVHLFHAEPRTVDANGHPNWSLAAIVPATLIASVGFAAMHADQLSDAIAPLLILYTVSLVLSAIRLRLRSLAASTLVHASYNATLFLGTFIATDGFRHLDKV